MGQSHLNPSLATSLRSIERPQADYAGDHQRLQLSQVLRIRETKISDQSLSAKAQLARLDTTDLNDIGESLMKIRHRV